MSANHIRQLKNQIFRQAAQSPTKYHCGHPQKESNAAYNSEFSNEFICFIIAVDEINNCSAAFVKLPQSATARNVSNIGSYILLSPHAITISLRVNF